MACVNLLARYPKTKRDLTARSQDKTADVVETARQFGFDFFDGDRKFGYGGLRYDPKYWTDTVSDFRCWYKFTESDSLLDIGCAKGFMLVDLKKLMPAMRVTGIDISKYAIDKAHPLIRDIVSVGDARHLNFSDSSFDYVISINTLHNLERSELIGALKEIERVKIKGSFITVDAYETQEEKEAMYAWNLTAKTILSVSEWEDLFDEAGYTGDYYWFKP